MDNTVETKSDYKETDIFARVKDGKIIDYPVSYQAIKNRCHPFDFYTKVEFDDAPIVPPFHTSVEKIEVLKDGRVLLRYLEPKAIPLENLFRVVSIETKPGLPNNASIFNVDLQNRIFTLIEERIESLLDTMVAERGYRNTESAISYEFSSQEQFSKDAVYVKELRDAIWVVFYEYKNKVFQKDLPFPIEWSIVQAALPAIRWPEK